MHQCNNFQFISKLVGRPVLKTYKNDSHSIETFDTLILFVSFLTSIYFVVIRSKVMLLVTLTVQVMPDL